MNDTHKSLEYFLNLLIELVAESPLSENVGILKELAEHWGVKIEDRGRPQGNDLISMEESIAVLRLIIETFGDVEPYCLHTPFLVDMHRRWRNAFCQTLPHGVTTYCD